MAKYIIDVPDDGQCQYKYNEDTKELKFPCPRIDPNSFMGLDIVLTGATPYTEPDKEPTVNEAWDFVKALYGLSDEELYEIFPNGCPYEMAYSEAKAKYEAWRKQKNEIHVGDEVRHTLTSAIGVVTQIKDLTIMWEDGSAGADRGEHIEKTGRRFDEVEDLLKKMEELDD